MRLDHDLDASAMIRAVLALVVMAAPLGAQLYVGTVRDSVSRMPIAGVVVSAMDSSGKPVSRTLANQNGLYRLTVPGAAARLRVQRIGYRMAEFLLRPADDDVTMDIMLTALPSLLERVNIVGTSACPKRRDNAQAHALYDQARAGLLATIVAREANPAAVVRYAFQRPVMLWADSAPVRVRIDSTKETTTPFRTIYSGEDLVRYGFKRRVGDAWQFAGPDAEVLLDEGFANGYCFSIARRDRSRPSQIGLAFAAADTRRGRVDILGTLWIDTVARALRSIEYKYTGAEGLAQFLETGGRTVFQEMPNGVVAVTQWSNRLLQETVDSVEDRFGNRRAVRGLVQNEGGGYLARASWPDGTQWVAPMGGANLTLLLNDTTPVIAGEVRLADTDYRGTSDSSGRVELRDLFPGRYRLVVRDTLLEELGFTPDPQAEFLSIPGIRVEGKVRVQSTVEQLIRKCRNRTSRTDLVAVVNVKDAAIGAPDVQVDITIRDRTFTETTSAHGSVVLCFDRDALGAPVTMMGTRGGMQTQRLQHVLNKRVTLFRLQLAPKPPLPKGTIPRDPH